MANYPAPIDPRIPGLKRRDFVRFGGVAIKKVGMQCQYCSRYVGGVDGYPDCTLDECGNRDVKVIGIFGKYHEYLIHKDHVARFVARVKANREKRGG